MRLPFGYEVSLEFAGRPGRPSTRPPQRKSMDYPQYRNRVNKTASPQNRSIPKCTPEALRKFSEHPVMRKAINAIKNPVLASPFCVEPYAGIQTTDTHRAQAQIVWNILRNPNPDDNFFDFMGAHLDDLLAGGWGPVETQSNGDANHPWWLWVPDGPTVEKVLNWNGRPEAIRYAQKVPGTNHKLLFSDMEMFYVRPNARSFTPYGLGPGEVAYETMSRLAAATHAAHGKVANETPPIIIHLGKDAKPHEVTDFGFMWEDDVEGTGKIAIIGGTEAPEILRLFDQTDEALHLGYIELLILVVALAFDLSPGKLGLNRDINRSTKEGQMQEDDEGAITPWRMLLCTSFTHQLIHKRLGFKELQLTTKVRDPKAEKLYAEMAQGDWDCNAITLDEYRAARGLGPSNDGHGNLRKYQVDLLARSQQASSDGTPPERT